MRLIGAECDTPAATALSGSAGFVGSGTTCLRKQRAAGPAGRAERVCNGSAYESGMESGESEHNQISTVPSSYASSGDSRTFRSTDSASRPTKMRHVPDRTPSRITVAAAAAESGALSR